MNEQHDLGWCWCGGWHGPSARETLNTTTAEQQGSDESSEGLTEAEVARLLSAAFHALGTHALSGHMTDLERRLTEAGSSILADRLAAVQADLAHEREHNAYLQTELDAEAKHAALAEGETCGVCTHLESEQMQQWMAADLDWQDRAESAETALATARREADEMRRAFGRPMTTPEQAKIAKAFERDRWAGEWNSLPTAIDNLLAARAALANPDNDPNGAS